MPKVQGELHIVGALELPTQDDGSILLARVKHARGEYRLSVKDRHRPEVTGQDEAEVTLDRSDLLTLIGQAVKLLREDEDY